MTAPLHVVPCTHDVTAHYDITDSAWDGGADDSWLVARVFVRVLAIAARDEGSAHLPEHTSYLVQPQRVEWGVKDDVAIPHRPEWRLGTDLVWPAPTPT
jgi:hypothetical protein